MRRLHVENFGPIKNADIQLKEVNLIIGEQSIGKSTLAKLITIFSDASSLAVILEYGFAWTAYLKMYGIDRYWTSHSAIAFQMNESSIDMGIEINGNSQSFTFTFNGEMVSDARSCSKILLDTRKVSANSRKLLTELENDFDKNKDITREEAQNRLDQLTNLVKEAIYVPSERIISSVISNIWPALSLSKSMLTDTLLHYMLALNEAKLANKSLDIPILNTTYVNTDGVDMFIVKETGQALPMSMASSGIQSTLPLLLLLEHSKDNKFLRTFVIEEPESNLYPDKQVELLKYILQTLRGDGQSITITTHSPYVLSAVNNMLCAGTIENEIDERKKEKLSTIFPKVLRLSQDSCSVYSLGSSANGDEIFCKDIVDKNTGMVDFNALDRVSMLLSEEFNQLEDIFLDSEN